MPQPPAQQEEARQQQQQQQQRRRRRRIGGGRVACLLQLLALSVAVLLLVCALPRGAEAGAYNPPLGEDARLDQIDDYPGKDLV
jgi:hypothetical protein